MSWEDYLQEVYYNPQNAGSFLGPDKLFRYVRKDGKYVLSKYKIRKWLQKQEAYSLQKPLRRRFRRNKIMVTSIDDQWSADLMDMAKFAKYNDGFMYILVVIDVLSKYLWMRPLKDKKGVSVAKALREILMEGRVPKRIRTDKGQEFRAKEVQKVLQDYEITHLFAQNETKAAVSERVIKTMKTRIYRFMTYKQSYEYTDKLQTFVRSYNNTYHRTIGIEPKKVNGGNETAVWWKMYWPRDGTIYKKTKTVRKPFRFKIGDRVRLTHIRNPFSREYDERWTGEIFIISQRILRGGLPLYRVQDFDGDEIKGTFYQSELQKVDVNDNGLWKVEEILKTRGKGRNKQYFVKWLHYPKKFNSWIKASDVSKL